MKKSVVVLLHAGYWLLYLFLLLIFFGMVAPQLVGDNPRATLVFALGQWALLMIPFAIIPGIIGFYTFYTWLFTRLLRKKKIAQFFVAALATGVTGALLGISILMLRVHPDKVESGELIAMLLLMFFVTIVNGVIGMVMKGFITWYGDIKRTEELNRKNFETELALVKAQLNPHFLFNTINNIDVLILKDPEKASDYLNRLSDMLRFMLYEAKGESIALTRELDYIEKYIALQRIRTNNADYIRYELDGDPGNRTIPPMLFIPFIENAFKYAENKKVENAVTIRIQLLPGKLEFTCRNHFSAVQQQTPDATRDGGLGMELMRKRLQLLYPGKHELTVSTVDQVFHVHLKLEHDEN